MEQFASVAGQLGPYALFTIILVYLLLKERHERSKSDDDPCEANTECMKRIVEIHSVIVREDDEGVKLVYARHKTLEAAIIRLADCTEAQTKLLTKIYDETRDTKREVESIQEKLKGSVGV